MKNQFSLFYVFVAIIFPLWVSGQENAKGDRPPVSVTQEKQVDGHRVRLSREEKRRQRLFYKRPKVQHTPRYEFYKRVEMAAKEKQRILKELYKPQYSNFAYFGHKKRPKKHKPYAMRYCKECGIRH